jgi:hypothetical protein
MEGNLHHLNERPFVHFVLDAESGFVFSTSPIFHCIPLGNQAWPFGRKALPYTHNYLKWHPPSKCFKFNVLTMHIPSMFSGYYRTLFPNTDLEISNLENISYFGFT